MKPTDFLGGEIFKWRTSISPQNPPLQALCKYAVRDFEFFPLCPRTPLETISCAHTADLTSNGSVSCHCARWPGEVIHLFTPWRRLAALFPQVCASPTAPALLGDNVAVCSWPPTASPLFIGVEEMVGGAALRKDAKACCPPVALPMVHHCFCLFLLCLLTIILFCSASFCSLPLKRCCGIFWGKKWHFEPQQTQKKSKR